MQRAPGGRDGVEARQRISACSAGAQPAGGQRRIPLPAAPCSGRRPGGAAPRPAAAGPAAPRASCGERPGPAGKALPVPHTSCGRCTPLSPSPPRTAPRPLLFLGAPREAAALRRSRSSQRRGDKGRPQRAGVWQGRRGYLAAVPPAPCAVPPPRRSATASSSPGPAACLQVPAGSARGAPRIGCRRCEGFWAL